MPKVFLDWEGLQAYHEGVEGALGKKQTKINVSSETPTDGSDIWLCITEDDGTEPQVMSTSLDNEELTFNESDPDEELSFNNEEDSEELTFNEEDSDEELTFNEE